MKRSLFSPSIVFGIVLFMAILACGGGGAAPEPAEPQSTQAAPAAEAPSAEPPGGPQFPIIGVPPPAVPEWRRLTLEYPPIIRAGDSDVVRLTLEADEAGDLTPTAVVQGNVITGETIEIPNLY